jgi:hypothetical protein
MPPESPQPPVHLHHVWHYTDVDRAFWREHLADWLPKRIFDAHTHVNEPALRLREPTEAMRRQYWVNEVNEPIGAEDARRCCEIVFPGRDITCLAFGMPSLDYDIEASNAALRPAVERLGWYGLAVLRPQWSAETVADLLDPPAIVGAKVYYALIGDDPATRDRYLEASIFEFLPPYQLDVLNERRAWLALHVPRAARLGHADNIREVRELRRRWPDVKVVIAHLGRCYTLEHAREALPRLAGDPGLYFDNSAVLNPDVHRFALELLGPRRILYGTDNPVFYMRGRRQWHGRTYANRTSYPFHFNTEREAPHLEAAYTLYMYEALRAIKTAACDLRLSREDVEAVFSANARRLVAP